jgi:hypothetical protein
MHIFLASILSGERVFLTSEAAPLATNLLLKPGGTKICKETICRQGDKKTYALRWLRLIENKVHARPYSTSARRERSLKIVVYQTFEEAFEALPNLGVCATTTIKHCANFPGLCRLVALQVSTLLDLRKRCACSCLLMKVKPVVLALEDPGA